MTKKQKIEQTIEEVREGIMEMCQENNRCENRYCKTCGFITKIISLVRASERKWIREGIDKIITGQITPVLIKDRIHKLLRPESDTEGK